MVNLIKRGRQERTRSPVSYRLDPFESMRQLVQWDPFGTPGQWPLSSEFAFVPSFEARETSDAYVIEADLPGLEEKDLDVALMGNRLTIHGTRTAEERQERDFYQMYERSYGGFARSFTLPQDADVDHIDANLANGVLTVRVPKRAEVTPRKIKIGRPLSNVLERMKGMLGSHRHTDDPSRRPS